MNLADLWYSSGTFWAAAGVIAVLGTGVAATIVSFWLANPIRRLDCLMSAAPLLKGAALEMPGNLHITWDGVELKDPHILELTLTSRGRRDISKDDFEQPLEFRVGAEIKAILRAASGPDSETFRAVTFKDDTLSIGPGLIHRRQSVKFTLLAVGPEPKLSSAAIALRDVKVELLSADSAEPSPRHWSRRTKVAATVAVTACAAGLVLAGLLIGHRPPQAGNHLAANSPTPAASLAGVAAASPTGAASVRPSATASALTSADKSLLAAEKDLRSGSKAEQSTGIAAVQAIMKASPGVQPAAVKALASYIHSQSPAGSNDQPVTTTVQAALDVLENRNPANDAGVLIDLDNTNLTNASLSGIDLTGASLVDTDFDGADLGGANLGNANLNYAFVGGASLEGADLTGANLVGASFYQTLLCHGSTPTQPGRGYNCSANG